MVGPDDSKAKPKLGSAPGRMPLGQASAYVDRYDPALLYPMPRAQARTGLDWPPGLSADRLPFVGEDVWTAFELSWLGAQGRPESAVLSIRVPANSPNIVESKSLKLYLNAFALTKFHQRNDLVQRLQEDLSGAFGARLMLELTTVDASHVQVLPGQCIDLAAVQLEHYQRMPSLLSSEAGDRVEKQALFTHQFRSLCPVTGQPDFASIWMEYSGPRIEPSALLAYLVSYRTHSGFHESAVEQIFLDLLDRCGCTELTVYGRFLRRGGIDINPLRSSQQRSAPSWRVGRQ